MSGSSAIGARRGSPVVPGLVALGSLIVLLGAGPAAAQSIAVTDVESASALATEAGALTLFLRSHVASSSRRVTRDDLAAAVEAIGPVSPAHLDVAADKRAALAKKLGAAVVATRLVVTEMNLRATATLITPDGAATALEPVTVGLGDVRLMAEELVQKVGAATGQVSVSRVKPAALAELGVVARAGRALAAGERSRAIELLAGCPPGLGLKVEAVADVTRPLVDDASLPLELRINAALVGGDLNAAKAVSEAGEGAVGAAGRARVAVATVDDPAAREALESARGSDERFVVLARVARASEFGDASEMPALFAPLIDGEPYLPALALATRFRPNLLGSKEAALVAAAERVRERHPELASELGVRAFRGGVTGPAVYRLIDAYLIDPAAVRELLSVLPSAAADDAAAARLVAEVSLRIGDAGTARAAHAKAAALTPDEPRLAKTKSILESLPEDERGPATNGPSDGGGDAGALDEATVRRLELLVDELEPLLSEFPLAADGVKKVVIAPLPGSRELFLWPWRVHPERLAEGLVATLARPDIGARGVVSPLETADKPTANELAAIANTHEAQATLLYGVRAAGGEAKIRLVYFAVESAAALEAEARISDAGDHGLVSVNPIFVILLVGVGGALVSWLVFVTVRGSGVIRVELKVDPAANKPSFSILISKSKECPVVSDPKEHLASVSVAEKRRRFGADNVGANEEFERIPPGRWFVHVYGTYGKGGELRALPPLSEPAQVRRNQITTVVVDLVPKESEFHFSLVVPDGPARGARLWLAANPGHKVTTNDDGEAILFATTGEHTVHIEHEGVAFTKKIHAYGSRISMVTINVERERRLAQIAGGLQVELGPDEDAPVIVPDRREAARQREVALTGGASTDRPDTLRGLRRYQPEAELGRGAMGVVYRATDQVLGRKVALKVMSPEIREHPTAAQMFEQEAKALAALNHPNVVTVFDQGRDGEQMFMVMEFVEGSTLEDVLEQRGRLELADAARIGEQIGRGLAYAHGRRVIHRDIKPANIFLADDGTVKLGDFGLARVIHEVSIKRTEVKGTPLYMAPEQIRGANIDFRADIYSVGCTLFEVLAGRPPFIEGEILYHHINTEPPPLSEFVTVPAEVDELIMKCIAKDARQRPASADRIADVFGKLRRG